jgi:anti-sigma factor RsiW
MVSAATEFPATVRYLRHLHAGRWLSAYADGEAPARRVAAVERHLVECPDCDDMVAFIVASKLVLSRSSELPMAGHDG